MDYTLLYEFGNSEDWYALLKLVFATTSAAVVLILVVKGLMRFRESLYLYSLRFTEAKNDRYLGIGITAAVLFAALPTLDFMWQLVARYSHQYTLIEGQISDLRMGPANRNSRGTIIGHSAVLGINQTMIDLPAKGSYCFSLARAEALHLKVGDQVRLAYISGFGRQRIVRLEKAN